MPARIVLTITKDVEFVRSVSVALPNCIEVRGVQLATFPGQIERSVIALVVEESSIAGKDWERAAIQLASTPIVFVRSGKVAPGAALGIGALVIGRSQLRSALWPMLRGAIVRRLRSYAAERFASGSRDGILSKRTAEILLSSEPPIHSVSNIARKIGCHRTALYKAWNRSFGVDAQTKLSEFVDVVMVLAALERMRMGTGWRRLLALSLKTCISRLDHSSRRIFGMSLAEVASDRFFEAIDIVHERVLLPFGIGPDDRSIAPQL